MQGLQKPCIREPWRAGRWITAWCHACSGFNQATQYYSQTMNISLNFSTCLLLYHIYLKHITWTGWDLWCSLSEKRQVAIYQHHMRLSSWACFFHFLNVINFLMYIETTFINDFKHYLQRFDEGKKSEGWDGSGDKMCVRALPQGLVQRAISQYNKSSSYRSGHIYIRELYYL